MQAVVAVLHLLCLPRKEHETEEEGTTETVAAIGTWRFHLKGCCPLGGEERLGGGGGCAKN